MLALLCGSCTALQGRFTIAAKHHMTIAEIYETDMVDVEKVTCDNCRNVRKLTDCVSVNVLVLLSNICTFCHWDG